MVRIEKAILSGRPLLLMNCEDDSFDNMVSPLIHHANHGSEVQGPEGKSCFSFHHMVSQIIYYTYHGCLIQRLEVNPKSYGFPFRSL